MKIETQISGQGKEGHEIRGVKLTELIETRDFTDVIFLMLRGSLPQPEEKKLLNAVLVSAVEHGVETPSVFVPRVSLSVGNELHVALASGLLSVGKRHGCAVSACAEVFSIEKTPKEIVSDFFEKAKRIPGFGHAVYKDGDPRVAVLYKTAQECGHSAVFEKALEIEKEIELQKGKKIKLNIDGAMAAILLDLGFPKDLGNGFFILARLVGMMAHLHEEAVGEDHGYYRLD